MLSLEREPLLPAPTLALRKEAADAREAALKARSAEEARGTLEGINEQIHAAIRAPLAGPPLNLSPLDIEGVLRERRELRAK